MKLNNYIVAGVLSASAFCANLSAQSKEEIDTYIKTFGQAVGASSFSDLNFNEEEMGLFIAGFQEGIKSGKMPENIQEIGQKMQEYLQGRAQKAQEEAAKKNEEASTDFFKKLAENPKVAKSESGLHYEIIEMGADPKPAPESVVVVNYTGTLIDGTVFDSSEKTGAPAEFPLNRVIPGFGEGLQKVGKGGKVKLYIPASIGYGNQPLPGIPAGSTLVFDVEIVDVKAPTPMDMVPPVPADHQN